VALLVALLVAAPLVAPRPVSAESSKASELVVQVDALVRSFPGGAGIVVSDPNAAQPLYTHDLDEPVITASLYKLGVLLEAERRVDAGTLRYSDTIEIAAEDITDDGSYEIAGTVLTIDEALEAMITVSDNGAALALRHDLTGAAIDKTLTAAGLGAFHVALDDSGDNVATPRVIAQYFTLLAKRQLVSAAASDRMLARLERQRINDRLPAQLPSNVVVAHKTGNLAGVTHDAGIIYTAFGPRVVVGMTWDAGEDDATHLLASLGSLVYAAVLEPPANARFQTPKGALAYEAGTAQSVGVSVTNAGSTPWTASGGGAIGLIWELRTAEQALVDRSRAPLALPALAPNETAPVALTFVAPSAAGSYTMTIGLVDSSGTALAALGAATATFAFTVHVPYLVASQAQLPRLLHRSEASLLIVQYSSLPAAAGAPHTYTLFWSAIDPATSRTVASGTSPLGAVPNGGSGTFFAPLVAPALRGTYRLQLEVQQGARTVSQAQTLTVELARARTYPDDRAGAVAPAPGPTGTPRPSGSQRPSSSASPHGRSPSPSPRSP
jgi:beta-lactamase class A